MRAKKKLKTLKNYNKINDLIRSITKNSDNYDEKYKKIKFDSDNDLPLNKTIEIHIVKIVVRAIFYENKQMLSTSFLRWMSV